MVILMILSMIITVVIGFVIFRETDSDDPEIIE